MWAALVAIHIQQAPGTRFSAYNELFSIVNSPSESLTNISARVSDAMGQIQELHPTNFDIHDLVKEIQLMAMLRALVPNLANSPCPSSCTMRSSPWPLPQRPFTSSRSSATLSTVSYSCLQAMQLCSPAHRLAPRSSPPRTHSASSAPRQPSGEVLGRHQGQVASC
jgi:hypothetical protein